MIIIKEIQACASIHMTFEAQAVIITLSVIIYQPNDNGATQWASVETNKKKKVNHNGWNIWRMENIGQTCTYKLYKYKWMYFRCHRQDRLFTARCLLYLFPILSPSDTRKHDVWWVLDSGRRIAFIFINNKKKKRQRSPVRLSPIRIEWTVGVERGDFVGRRPPHFDRLLSDIRADLFRLEWFLDFCSSLTVRRCRTNSNRHFLGSVNSKSTQPV